MSSFLVLAAVHCAAAAASRSAVPPGIASGAGAPQAAAGAPPDEVDPRAAWLAAPPPPPVQFPRPRPPYRMMSFGYNQTASLFCNTSGCFPDRSGPPRGG
jgi:hypothetical protein